MSWNENYVATSGRNSNGMIASLAKPGQRRGFSGGVTNYQATSLVICNNLLIQGGAILDEEGKGGFIRAFGLEDGNPVWEKTFDAKLAFNGLAVDTCGIIASFDDGRVICLK